MISNWTFDATGREHTIHATVKKNGAGSYTVALGRHQPNRRHRR